MYLSYRMHFQFKMLQNMVILRKYLKKEIIFSNLSNFSSSLTHAQKEKK